MVAALDKYVPDVLASQRQPTAVFDQEVITQECFDAVLQLRQPQSRDDLQRTYERLRGSLDALLGQPEVLGLTRGDAEDIAYAVIALADEVALKASPELAQFWLPRMLQLHYFNENMAGEGFFQRLDNLRQQPGRRLTLQAYYVALALGFRGRYDVDGASHELSALIASLRQSLVAGVAARFSALSPHGEPQPRTRLRGTGWRRAWIYPMAVIAFVALSFAGMRLSLRHGTAALLATAVSVQALLAGE